jgi:hypothetical protein
MLSPVLPHSITALYRAELSTWAFLQEHGPPAPTEQNIALNPESRDTSECACVPLFSLGALAVVKRLLQTAFLKFQTTSSFFTLPFSVTTLIIFKLKTENVFSFREGRKEKKTRS